jgi:hypothetical protein
VNVRAARTAALVGALLSLGACGGSSSNDASTEPATSTGFSADQQTSLDEALETAAEREKAIFPSFPPAQQDGYREAFILCTGYWENYDYTLITDYVMAREDAAYGSVEDAEATGCSDATADDPLPGSGFVRRDP